MKKAPIKLFKLGELPNGTERFQSQLHIGRDTADFIKEDGIMKVYGRNPKSGFGFHEFTEPFIIVNAISEMKTQQL